MASAAPRPLIAGNWKMNGLAAQLAELDAVSAAVAAGKAGPAELLVCPPATLLDRAAQRLAGRGVALGGQDCHPDPNGAHTGDLSAEMLRDAGASYVIVGHSERRVDHGETDAVVRAKAGAARRAGLVPVLCIGETRLQRDAGQTLDVLGAQLTGSMPDGLTPDTLVLAYEPVWAIGTGLTPTLADVDEVHDFLRERLVAALGEGGRQVRILYGGSVKPGNAADLLAIRHVDGALVGGASLKAADFLGIAAGCP